MEIDEKSIEAVARAMCHSVPKYNNMVAEIMDQPSYPPGCEGYAKYITTAGRFREDAQAAITAYKRAREAQGYVEVPVEPTEAMLDAVAGAPFRFLSSGKQAAERDAYRAMLAARPQKEEE